MLQTLHLGLKVFKFFKFMIITVILADNNRTYVFVTRRNFFFFDLCHESPRKSQKIVYNILQGLRNCFYPLPAVAKVSIFAPQACKQNMVDNSKLQFDFSKFYFRSINHFIFISCRVGTTIIANNVLKKSE